MGPVKKLIAQLRDAPKIHASASGSAGRLTPAIVNGELMKRRRKNRAGIWASPAKEPAEKTSSWLTPAGRIGPPLAVASCERIVFPAKSRINFLQCGGYRAW
jgi:hypothetical protein